MHKTPAEDQARTAQSNAAKSNNGLMSGSLRPIAEGLGSQLADLQARAKQALNLTDLVRTTLPEAVKSHVLSASYRDDVLVISTDSAAWTAQVRYCESALREHLANAGEKPFTKLKVRVGHPPT
jgi:hypothetical protein